MSRAAIYQLFRRIPDADDAAVDAAVDALADRVATKADLGVLGAEWKADLSALRAEWKADIALLAERISALDGRFTGLQWMVGLFAGLIVALNIAVLIEVA